MIRIEILLTLSIKFNTWNPWTFEEWYELVVPQTFELDIIFKLSAITSFTSMFCNPVEENLKLQQNILRDNSSIKNIMHQILHIGRLNLSSKKVKVI